MLLNLESKLQQQFKQYTQHERIFLDNLVTPKVWEHFKPCDAGKANQQNVKYLLHADSYLPSGELIGVFKNDRFTPVPTHFHDYIELVYVWSGCCEQTINGNKIFFHQGDVCILNTQAEHSLGIAGEDDLIINVLIRREYFESAFYNRINNLGLLFQFLIDAVALSQKTENHICFSLGDNEVVRSAFVHLFREFVWPGLGSKQVIDSYMAILLTELFRSCYDVTMDRHIENVYEYRIIEILEYLSKNYGNCTLQSVAQHFGLHPNYLTMLLKEKTGRSFLEHVQAQRMDKARTLLKNTSMPISEIISKCGYQNTHFFYQKFRQEEKCTPAAYRTNSQLKSM